MFENILTYCVHPVKRHRRSTDKLFEIFKYLNLTSIKIQVVSTLDILNLQQILFRW